METFFAYKKCVYSHYFHLCCAVEDDGMLYAVSVSDFLTGWICSTQPPFASIKKYPRPSMPALESATTNHVAIVQTSDPHFLLSPLSWATYTPPSVWLIGWLTGFKASNIQLLSIFKDLELDIMQVYVVVYIKLFLRVFPPQHSILIILNCIKLVWIRRGRYMISFTVYWE